MGKIISWNEYEAVLLVDAYLAVREKKISKELAVKQLSKQLRDLGRANGVSVDDVYRNENGISMRMAELDRLFNDGMGGLKNTSKLFVDTVGMYAIDRKKFDELLQEAKRMIGLKEHNRTAFLAWLKKQPKVKLPPEYIVALLDEGSSYAVARRLAPASFWEIDDAREFDVSCRRLLGSHLFRVLHRKSATSLDKCYLYYKEFLSEKTHSENKTSPSPALAPTLEGNTTNEEVAVSETVKQVVPSALVEPNTIGDDSSDTAERETTADNEERNSQIEAEEARNEEATVAEKTAPETTYDGSDEENEKQNNTPEDSVALEEKLHELLRAVCAVNSNGAFLSGLAKSLNVSEESVEQILTKADWVTYQSGRYTLIDNSVQKTTASAARTDSPKNSEMVFKYSFERPQSLAFTRPISLTYFEDTVIKTDSWRQLYLDFLKVINDDYPHYIAAIKGKKYGSANLPIIADKTAATMMIAPKEFAAGLFVETIRSANNIMENLKRILEACYVDYENVVVLYAKTTDGVEEVKEPPSTQQSKSEKDQNITIVEAVSTVLQNADKPLTTTEIYNRIIEKNLYTFGAKDPIHVVEVKINAACKGSGYSYRAPQDLFGSVWMNGKKQYYLLSREQEMIPTITAEKAAPAVSDPAVRTEADKKLQEYYPVLFKRIHDALKEYGDIRVSAETIRDKTGSISRLTTIKRILNGASWSEQCGTNYKYSAKPIQSRLPDEQPQTQPTLTGENEFYHWLETVKQLPSSECSRYTSGLHVLSRFLKAECSVVSDLFATQEMESLSAYWTVIEKHPAFLVLAANQRERLTSSMHLYMEYIESLTGAKAKSVSAAARAKEKEFCQWAALRVGPGSARNYADKLKFIQDRCIENKLIEKPFFELEKSDDFSKVLECAKKLKFPFVLQYSTRADIAKAIPLYYGFLHKDEEIKQSARLPKNVKVLDFKEIGDLSFTKPVRLKYLDHESQEFNSWADLYTKLLFMLRVDHPRTIADGTSLSGSASPDVAADPSKMRAPKAIGKNLYAETNHDTRGLINRMAAALSLCGVSLKKVEIQYLVREKTLPAGTAKKVAVDSQQMSKLVAFVKSAPDGASKDKIKAAFPDIKPSILDAMLDIDSIVILNKKYYHKNNIEDFDEAADIILSTLQSQFLREGGYTSAKMLYDELHARLDDFFFDNGGFDSQIELYDLAKYLFEKVKYKGHKFVFAENKHIWETEPDYPKTYLGLMSHWAKRQNGIMTRAEIMDRLIDLGSNSPASSFSALMSGSTQNTKEKVFLMYDEYRYVLTEDCHIDEDFLLILRRSLEELLDGDDYLALDDIDDYFYSTLPALPSGAIWTVHMLKSVLSFFDVGFSTVAVGGENDMKTPDAALVRKNSNYKSFSDVLWAEINRDYELPREFTAEEFREILLRKGFIHGLEKLYSIHATVEGDLRFFWTSNNSMVTISK